MKDTALTPLLPDGLLEKTVTSRNCSKVSFEAEEVIHGNVNFTSSRGNGAYDDNEKSTGTSCTPPVDLMVTKTSGTRATE